VSGTLIQVERRGAVALVRLNRPEKRNAMNDALRLALVEALEEIAADPAVRAMVLTGNGKGFCAGGDVAAMRHRLDVPAGEVGFAGWSRQQRLHHAQAFLHALPIPTVAAVHGAAAGLGADIALACDFVVAAQDASFAWSYINRGLIPDGGGLYLLPRRVGLARAKELVFTGRRVPAAEAADLGLVDRVSSPETMVDDACAWAAELGKGSRVALALGKSILNQSFEQPMEQIFALGSQAQGLCYTSAEHRAAVEEFLAGTAAQPGGKGR